jgi:hypothetical protein
MLSSSSYYCDAWEKNLSWSFANWEYRVIGFCLREIRREEAFEEFKSRSDNIFIDIN